MITEPAATAPHRPPGVTVVALVNGVAVLLHLAFWLLVLAHLPSPLEVGEPLARAAAATTRGFGIADLLLSVPLLAAGSIGLWRLAGWGWLAAQMAHALYAYSLTVVVVRDLYAGAPSPGTMLFLPFALFGLGAALYLWRRRHLFFGADA